MSRSFFLTISSAIFLAAAFVSCSDGPKVIPARKMEKIYEEMFTADKWLHYNTELRGVADTSLVYDPIFRKYGYTYEDYCHTVSVYMDDPGKFEKLVEKVHSGFDERKKVLQAESERRREVRSALEKNKAPESGFPRYDRVDFSLVRTDTIVFERDTIGRCSVAVPKPWPPLMPFGEETKGWIWDNFINSRLPFGKTGEQVEMELEKDRLKDAEDKSLVR